MKKMFKIILIILIVIFVGLIIKKIFFANRKVVIDREKIIANDSTIKATVFDGTEITGAANITIKGGKLLNENIVFSNEEIDTEYFLMPGLIDAHSHTASNEKMEEILNNGVTSICDVASSKEKANNSEKLNVWTALTTVMPGISNGKSTVNSLISQGADYIKVMVDMPAIMGGGLIEKNILQDMVDTAHKNNLKIAAHVTTIEAVRLAVDCNVDILIHIPIGEEFPEDLARQIADKNISVIPTLVMMKAFANSPLYGFKKDDYEDAKSAVKLLNTCGVNILAGTDANSSFFVPKIEHGSSLHEEMELLVDAGMTPLEVLRSATSNTIGAFGLENEHQKSIMVLIEGRPDKNITDTTKIRQIWIEGEPLLESLNMSEKN